MNFANRSAYRPGKRLREANRIACGIYTGNISGSNWVVVSPTLEKANSFIELVAERLASFDDIGTVAELVEELKK